ncbi:MAG: deoxyribodipyrimidine photolyase [Pedobacter sp.]|nr:deoxyribodipyrimidine photolyase [Pedobacter sp.]
MELQFATDYKTILQKIAEIDPLAYGKTRNYVDGAVTYLSPYISRGVISTKQVLKHILARGYKIKEIESFVKELCWRDYFQRVAQEKDLSQDIKQPQYPVSNREIPSQILNASTGITGIDIAIQQLYDTGYMHNHCRMYTASLVCNFAKSYWQHPAQWMYYYLLDGDWASNTLSWQWVAGANSNKKYYTNQENINKYTHTNQQNTFLDLSYEEIANLETPKQLLTTQKFFAKTDLPISESFHLDSNLPTFIYNYYNLDPLWHKGKIGNRILLLEPDFFTAHPVSKKCIDFMLALAKNIPELKIYVGSFTSLFNSHHLAPVYYKEHPLNISYAGIAESRDWIITEISGYYPSFFSYWKKVEKQLLINYPI